jgi:hypothetical protein
MNQKVRVWTLMVVLGGGFLAGRAIVAQVRNQAWGQVHVSKTVLVVEPKADDPDRSSVEIVQYRNADPAAADTVFSPVRTAGLWVAAFFTLCIFSYLYKDNPFYKFAESIVVGVSAGYWAVSQFWDVIVGKLLVKVAPDAARAWAAPGIPADQPADYSYLAPMLLGLLLFSRLIPGMAWLSRWPLAFIVGITAGLRLVLFLDSDFVSQIRSTLEPLAVFLQVEGVRAFQFWDSLRNVVLLVSVLACLAYFYFSAEHKGVLGVASRYGVWVLMITFGASFANTVMGRITLLTLRLEFLYRDWLGLIPRE